LIDWDEREKIPDPEATKPEDWDETAPRQIPDLAAEKPDGWLDDEPDMVPDPEVQFYMFSLCLCHYCLGFLRVFYHISPHPFPKVTPPPKKKQKKTTTDMTDLNSSLPI
jgi:hypothetical protein